MTKNKVEKPCLRCGVEKRPKDFLDENPVCKDCAMVTVSIDAIKDFQVCSLFYDYRYNKHLNEPTNNRDIMAERFRNTIIRAANFFFYKKQSGVPTSYNALVNRWERLWFPKDMDAYDLMLEQHTISHGNLVQYSNIAVQSLKRLYEDFEDKTIQPLLIKEEYNVPLHRDVILNGDIDLTYRQGDQYTAIHWSTGQRKPGLATFQMELAALKLAYQHRDHSNRRVNYAIYDLGSESPGMIKIPESDIMSGVIEFWSKEMLDQKYVPRRGYTAYCKGCPFDAACREFEFA